MVRESMKEGKKRRGVKLEMKVSGKGSRENKEKTEGAKMEKRKETRKKKGSVRNKKW